MSELLDRIRTRGYWEVSVRPEPYSDDRIDYLDLFRTIQSVTVRMRGWPVPFIDGRQPFLRGSDWIGEDVDARAVSHDEAWRFFTSGHFTQLRVVSADRRIGAEATPVPVGAASVIEVWEPLFYLTEVAELASRLASSVSAPHVTVAASLHGMNGRQLIAGVPERDLGGVYISTEDVIHQRRTVTSASLAESSRPLAVTMTRGLIGHFGVNISEQVLRDWQTDLTDRR